MPDTNPSASAHSDNEGERRQIGESEMKTSSVFSSHPEEEILDLYVMGRLKGNDLARIQEHIEQCEECQVKAMEFGEWVNTLRDASREARSEDKYHQPSFHWFRKPVFLAVGAVAAVAVMVPLLRKPPEVQSVELTTLRGNGQSDGINDAEAGRPLDLKIDLTGTPENNCCLVEIVDASGKVLSRSETIVSNRTTRARTEPLDEGKYWVRVFTTGGAPLREMGLEVR